jgi:hypothetical protein
LMHLASGVCSNPQLRNSFDSTVVYLSGEMAALKTLNVYHRTTAAVKVKTDSDNDEQSGTDTDLEEEDSDPQAEDQSEEEEEGQVESEPESDPEEPEQEEQDEPAARGKRSVQATQTQGVTRKRARRYVHTNVPQAQQEPEIALAIRPQDLKLMLKGIENQLEKLKKYFK